MKVSVWSALVALVISVASCATAPKTVAERNALETQARATLKSMRARDPGIDMILDRAVGYVVFPEIAKAGVVAGAAYGRGVLFERGLPVGYVELNQGSIGAQLGAQTFSELIVLQSIEHVDRMKTGTFSVGGDVSAVALTTGVAAQAEFRNGVAVFVMPRGGLMAELTVSGQQINYEPRRPPRG
jgi:lipid-binding SYLF domain-containing protein